MMNSPHQRHKYRPVLSYDEITELIQVLHENPSPRRTRLVNYLEGLSLKITSGNLYVASENRPTKMIDKLELAPVEKSYTDESKQKLYIRWQLYPEKLTAWELEQVMEYRYTHDLMTPQEEQAYENS